MQRGPFIVFEGLDGSGRTTQAELLKSRLEENDDRRVYLTREPSDGPVGNLIRLALRRRITLDPKAMALLFAADRIDHLAWEIIEKRSQDVTVICDRYYLSSFAYQLLDAPGDLDWLERINAKAVSPDLTIMIDVSAEVCMERIQRRGEHIELFEELECLRAVRENYLSLARGPRRQSDAIFVVDGNQSRERVHAEVHEIVTDRFGGKFQPPDPGGQIE